MKRPVSVLIALVVMAAMVLALATPTLANHRDDSDDEDCFEVDGLVICDEDRDVFDGALLGDGIDQETEQDADSGDIDQDFSVTSTGDNSNQCVGTQGVANTGNAQTAESFGLLGGDFDDFDIDDSGADIDESGSSDTSCDQQVNQAASASG